jgi:hypothetical protein
MKKNFNLIFASLILIVIVAILVFLFGFAYKGLKEEVSNTKSNMIYANVLEKGANYIKVKDVNNDDTYYLKYEGNASEGDIISIEYKDNIDNYSDIEVIVDSEDDILIIDTTTTSTTTTSVTTTTTTKVSDDDIISIVEGTYNDASSDNSSSITSTLKSKFIDIVDFIFYDKEINGRTFNSLTNEAKGKVLYYAILLDNKIDSKWPNAKENIQSKYLNIKEKLIAKYMDLTTSVCSNNEKSCTTFKNDFSLMKSSIKITWDLIKTAFKYAVNKSSSALVNWYEVFSGKV